MAQNNQNTSYLCRFWLFRGHAHMDEKKIYKGPQVGRMFGPLSELKNKPPTKSFGPSFKTRNGPKQPENKFFILYSAILGSFWHP
jgi:hypothetical protein